MKVCHFKMIYVYAIGCFSGVTTWLCLCIEEFKKRVLTVAKEHVDPISVIMALHPGGWKLGWKPRDREGGAHLLHN